MKDKLVRDKMPHLAKSEGKDTSIFRRAERVEIPDLLADKLVSESQELATALRKGTNEPTLLEKLGNLMEIFSATRQFLKIPPIKIMDKRCEVTRKDGEYEEFVVQKEES